MAYELPGTKDGSPDLFVFEKFGSLNNKATRAAVKDEGVSWIENWMQIGDGNLRTIYDKGSNWYTAPGGKSILYQFNASFSGSAFGSGPFLFFTDGTAVQVLNSGGSTATLSNV